MKTVTHLKAGLVSRTALEARQVAESFGDKERVSEAKKTDLFTRAFVKMCERFVRLRHG